MNPDELDEILRRTLEDRRLSRSERKALAPLLAAAGGDSRRRSLMRHRAFALARESLARREDRELLEWLEGVVRLLDPPGRPATRSEACFSRRDDCVSRIASLFGAAGRSAEVCVFTITDDRLSDAIVRAHRRGVSLRVITDDEKMHEPGSDVGRLLELGIPLRIDQRESHMHHKFALFDRELLLTGSYNWTRGAAERNDENFVVTGDPGLVRRYGEEFERLWELFGS